MYEIAVERHFDAAHYLRGYRGKCEALHGHRYKIVARVRAERLDKTGLACDFAELKHHLDDILARLDHTCLNDVRPFDKINPSAENIAATIYKELKRKLAKAPVTLAAVEAWESPENCIIYREG
jgi:6-pyruvoyltetrahydropterin/6-carboxytetrahydropterin synthase